MLVKSVTDLEIDEAIREAWTILYAEPAASPLGECREIGGAGFKHLFETDVQACFGMALIAGIPISRRFPENLSDPKRPNLLYALKLRHPADYLRD